MAQQRRDFCPNMNLIMTMQWNTEKNLDLMRVRCKQWSCRYCARLNAAAWRNHLLTRLNKHEFSQEKWVLITLTAHEDTHKAGPKATFKNLQRAFSRLYHRITRLNRKPFHYARIFERHPQSGNFHMHIIASLGETYERLEDLMNQVQKREDDIKAENRRRKEAAKITGKEPKLLKQKKRLKREKTLERWFKDNARNLGLGHQADVKYLGENSHQAAVYMTKYIGKQFYDYTDLQTGEKTSIHVEIEPRQRRILTSQKIGSPKRKNAPRGYAPRSAIYREDLDTYQRIYDLSIKHQVTYESDFADGQLWYPDLLV